MTTGSNQINSDGFVKESMYPFQYGYNQPQRKRFTPNGRGNFNCIFHNFGNIPKGGTVVNKEFPGIYRDPGDSKDNVIDPSTILSYILSSREKDRNNKIFPFNEEYCHHDGRTDANLIKMNGTTPNDEFKEIISRRPMSSALAKSNSSFQNIFKRPKTTGAMHSHNDNIMKLRHAYRPRLNTETKFGNVYEKISNFEKKSACNCMKQTPKRRNPSKKSSTSKSSVGKKCPSRLVPIKIIQSSEIADIRSSCDHLKQKTVPVTFWGRREDPSRTSMNMEKIEEEKELIWEERKSNSRNQKCRCSSRKTDDDLFWSRYYGSDDLDGNWSFGSKILANGTILSMPSSKKGCHHCRSNNIATGNYIFGFYDRSGVGKVSDIGESDKLKRDSQYSGPQQIRNRKNTFMRVEDNIETVSSNDKRHVQECNSSHSRININHASRSRLRRRRGLRHVCLGILLLILLIVVIFSIVYLQMLS